MQAKAGLDQRDEMATIDGARLVFLGGLHRSGTSIVHRLLRGHPNVSGFQNTTAPEDEGQHLQSVFPTAKQFGGPGRFAFATAAHMLEASECVSEEHRRKLSREWAAFYDLSKKILLEKSPPNLIRGRFLQAMFPGARFLFIVRHPIPVSYATQKWSKTSILELLFHWCIAHWIMLDDLSYLHRALVIRYEDFVSGPTSVLNMIYDFLELDGVTPRESVSDHNLSYFSRWNLDRNMPASKIEQILDQAVGPMQKFGYRLAEPYTSPIDRGHLLVGVPRLP